MRKRKWKSPCNPTPMAKQVWVALYSDPWPKGWKVQWVGFMRGARGLCVYSEKRVLLGWGDFKKSTGEPIRTLIHEFVHMRCGPSLRHGKEFNTLWTDGLVKLGLDPGVGGDPRVRN